MRGAIGSNVGLQPGALASRLFFSGFGAATVSGLMVAQRQENLGAGETIAHEQRYHE
jgi:hypothetical protein